VATVANRTLCEATNLTIAMKSRLTVLALLCCSALTGAALAQSPGGKAPGGKAPGGKAPDPKAQAPKSAADLAFEEYNKVRTGSAKKDQAQFQKVIALGTAFLEKNPTYGRANDVVNSLAFYPNAIDKKDAAQRTSYLSFLKLEVTNLRYKEGLSDPAKAAMAAVDAAIADFEVRDAFNRDNLALFREKIDALAEVPGSGRFLVERERSYVHILTLGTSLARAEEHLKKMLDHKDKGVAAMARTELNLVEMKKAPFELKFTGFDGKEVDVAQLRGKVVALYFWSSTNKQSLGNFDGLKQGYSTYRKKGFEVVTVSLDKAEDREKVAAAIKDNKIAWPVHYDGKGSKNETIAKLNVTGVPALLVLDQKGMLQHTMQGTILTVNLPFNQLEGQVKRLLGVK
jgi:peroxiredoxin